MFAPVENCDCAGPDDGELLYRQASAFGSGGACAAGSAAFTGAGSAGVNGEPLRRPPSPVRSFCFLDPGVGGVDNVELGPVAPSALTPAINEQIWSLDKNTLVFNPILMDEIMANTLAQRRFTMSLLSGFGVVALVLAAIGIYGVLSCTVAQRTSEIGVRMALGARRSDVGRMVLREALLLTLLAISAGCGISLLVTRALRGLLFEVSPSDPAVLALVAAGVLAVTAFSAFLPAWRATSIEPTLALRQE